MGRVTGNRRFGFSALPHLPDLPQCKPVVGMVNDLAFSPACRGTALRERADAVVKSRLHEGVTWAFESSRTVAATSSGSCTSSSWRMSCRVPPNVALSVEGSEMRGWHRNGWP
jgi:hypothetical protein